MNLIRLQFDRWGFRIDGGFLYSYATREEARLAWWRMMGGPQRVPDWENCP